MSKNQSKSGENSGEKAKVLSALRKAAAKELSNPDLGKHTCFTCISLEYAMRTEHGDESLECSDLLEELAKDFCQRNGYEVHEGFINVQAKKQMTNSRRLMHKERHTWSKLAQLEYADHCRNLRIQWLTCRSN